jgi:hypothetical protein
MRTNVEVYENHCVILRRLNRFGIKEPIRIKGSYKEWITYFAKFKLDLKEHLKFNPSEIPREGCILTGHDEDEFL